MAKEAAALEVVDGVADDVAGGVKDGGDDEEISDKRVEGGHGLVEWDDHVERGAAEIGH